MIDATLNYLFATKTGYDQYDKLIIDVLMTGKERYPQAKESLLKMLDTLVMMFTNDLVMAYPNAEKRRCQQVAYSILCMSMSNETFMWIGMKADYNQAARAGAEALLKTLS